MQAINNYFYSSIASLGYVAIIKLIFTTFYYHM